MLNPEEQALTTREARLRIAPPEREIRVTPVDMRQARFASALRGFDKGEVATFLQEAAEGFERGGVRLADLGRQDWVDDDRPDQLAQLGGT